MSLIAYADESGTTSNAKCYAIGVVSVASARRAAFENRMAALLQSHGVVGEAKWHKVSTSHGLMNFTLDAFSHLLKSRTACFDVIVVHKELFRNWRSQTFGQEAAFYQTYMYLLKHIALRARQTTEVLIDDRSDSYSRRPEVVEAIGNSMLKSLHAAGRLHRVRKEPSHDHVGIQVADVLTGAVWASHERRLAPGRPMHAGKTLTIQRLARLVGWDELCYDTFPSGGFNVWHFPKEYRGTPRTMAVVPSGTPNYVTSADL